MTEHRRCVADNMVLAMFVDSGRAELLPALAGGPVHVPKSILHPADLPPFHESPGSEFARGAFDYQEEFGRPAPDVLLVRRMAFIGAVNVSWAPIEMSDDESALATAFVNLGRGPHARPDGKSRIGQGEAEGAAVAVSRDWTLWSDDARIAKLLAANAPGHHLERISDLMARAVADKFLACPDAADLYNRVFTAQLGLWSTLRLGCDGDRLVVPPA